MKAAVEPKLEFSSTPKEYGMSSPSRCEQLSEPCNSEPVAPLSLCLHFVSPKTKEIEVQKGHFWPERAQAILHIHTQCTP